MSPKLLDLRPNRSHLDPNFNGYKLSLEKIPVIRKALDISVDHVLPSNDQYSFLHAKLFGLHNHLIGEISSDNEYVYFVDKNQCIQRACLNELSTSLELTKVWEVPEFKQHRNGDYNFSLMFASKSIAVVSNGAGILYVLDTGSRSDNTTWQCVYCDEVIGPDKQFILQDVVLNENKLNCLLFSVEQDSLSKKHSAILHWVTLLQAEDKSWGPVALRELRSRGDLFYAYFEPNCNAIYIVSENGCKFTVDSENPIKDKVSEESSDIKYRWIQSYEDVTLKFDLPEDSNKDNVNIKIDSDEISVGYQSNVLLKGKLTHKVHKDETTWTITNNLLEVLLTKTQNGVMWTEVIEGDCAGKVDITPSAVEEAHRRLEHLCNENEVLEANDEQGPIFTRQQVEECDFEDDKLTFFERINCISHEVTHRANLGSHHVLLTVRLSEDLPPAMAVRYDVDACLWQPLGSDDSFSLNHEATLLAFGYVQASKQQKKFCVCAPDMGYSVICESTMHVFIYMQNKPIGSAELRNRTTGRRFGTVAQQQVVNVSEEEILGIYAANNVLYLLTENSVLALKL